MKRIKNSLTFLLVICLLMGTSAIYGADMSNVEVCNVNLDDENYKIESVITPLYKEVWIFDESDILVAHSKFDFMTNTLYDLYNGNVYFPHSSQVRGLRYGEYEDPDGEGYIYQGEYVYPLGQVSSMPAFISLLVGNGWDVGKAAAAAKAVYDFSTSYFEISGTQWYKTDEVYDYSKRIETVYEYLSGNGKNPLATYTLRQKKMI